MLVFISSPYRGNIAENTRKAKEYCMLAIKQGHTPFAPHLLYPGIVDDDATGILLGLDVLERCDELWQFGKCTEGMKIEGQYALLNGIPIVRKDA